MMINSKRKIILALLCGMLGCVFMGSGDWLMMYGSTAYHGNLYWLTEGVAQIPAWRNSLSMLVVFSEVFMLPPFLYWFYLLASGDGCCDFYICKKDSKWDKQRQSAEQEREGRMNKSSF